MRRRTRPLRTLVARTLATLWTARGRRALSRGDVEGAIGMLERALIWRPGAFGPLLHLTRAYLRRRELYRAHNTLVKARASDPQRFERLAPRWLAREGVDLTSLVRAFGSVGGPAGRASRTGTATAVRPSVSRAVTAASLPFGDCRDLDEYARFQAMPPISVAERESVDWPALLEDLLDD